MEPRYQLAVWALVGSILGVFADRDCSAWAEEPVPVFGSDDVGSAGEKPSTPAPPSGGNSFNSTGAAAASTEPLDRPLGSAWLGGDGGPLVFGPAEPSLTADSQAWPNIKMPGPDMGDFPNSSFTLPKGRSYIEFSPMTLANADRQAPPSYTSHFLLRYGLTDNLEFRVFSNGVTHVGGSKPSTGFSPLNFDLKVHLWDDRKEWFLPASSLEVYILTPWGSSQFTGGWQPSVNLNFDLPIARKTNLEWTLGYTSVQEAVNITTQEVFIPRFNFLVPGTHRTFAANFNQFSAQWAIERDITDQLQVFVHGFHNGAIHFNLGAGEMVGVGAFWKFSSRWMAFGSINTGLTPNLPSLAGQIGFAVAL